MLRTRSPVVSREASFSLLPLDLHVLGLPLAFILSQDQTLRCKNVELFMTSFDVLLLQYLKELFFQFCRFLF